MTSTTLTERRKADRAALAAQVADLAGRHGITARIISGEHQRPRAMFVSLEAPHGLRLTVAFDGSNPQREADTYVLSWHGVERGWRLNPRRFGRVNPYHGHKATDVAHGTGPLLDMLGRRFAAIADETAFIAAPGGQS